MTGFCREDTLFSLCGLNCVLCPMHLGGYCPGCGGGEGNQPCAVARCSRQHDGVAYCFQCRDYPCGRYADDDAYDSFITHRRRRRDLEQAQRDGIESYHAALTEKAAILHTLLERYNDGRRKTLYCAAVNLLDLEDLRAVMARLNTDDAADRPLADRAKRTVGLLQARADACGIELKLRKKPRRAT